MMRITSVLRNSVFSASCDSFVVCLIEILRLSFCAKNLPLRQALPVMLKDGSIKIKLTVKDRQNANSSQN
jgi:hypothetical protein